MKWVIHAKEGLLNLSYAKLRSSLALLGILVGTASVVAMVLGGQLATNEALSQFKTLGTDLLAVSINNASQELNASQSPEITLAQAIALNKVDKDIKQVAPYTEFYLPAFYGGKSLNAIFLGVTNQFAEIVQIHLQAGRFISTADKYNLYAVIGSGLYEEMKKISSQEPLGQHFRVGDNVFTVVGIAEPWPENSFIYASIDHSILVPILTSGILSKHAAIHNVIMRLTPDAPIMSVQKNITTYLHQVLTNKNIFFRSAKELIAKMKKQSDILTVFLGFIGGVSLLVGGIGVMNIMLVSVVERKREIGIRLAVGATSRDIGMLFLVEAIMLSLLGGTLGVLIGIFIAYFIAWFWHWQFTFFFLPPLVGFTVSVLVGVFFGYYPAYLASKLKPIEALRSE